MQEKPAQSAKSSMSIVEKMVRVYATTLTDAKLSAIEEIRERLLSALTATGLTEEQIEGLASGEMVVVPAEPTRGAQLALLNYTLAGKNTDEIYRAMIEAAKEG